MMMSETDQVDQSEVDDFYLDDILSELERGDDHLQDANTPIGMEGVEMTTSPPIHSNQDFAKKPEFRSSVSQHMMPVDSLYYDSTAATSSASGLTKTTVTEAFGQSSNLWNMSVCSRDFISYPVGSAMPSSTSQNIKSEFPVTSPIQQVSQMHRRHQLRKQLLTQKIQQPYNQPSLTLQANDLYTNHTLQNHIMREQHQSSPSLMPTIPQDRRQIGRLPNQQQFYLDSNISGMQSQQQIFKTQSVVIGEKTHQNASHMFQQPGFTAPQQIIQKTMNPVQVNFQLPRISNKPNNSSQDDMQHSSQKPAMLGHHQSIRLGGQQKPLDLLQGANPDQGWPGASVDPAVHNEHAALSDWHCEAYLQIQSIKEACLPDLRRLHDNANELIREAPNSEFGAKYEKTRAYIERMIKLLHTSRDDLISITKGKIYSHLKGIISFINKSKTAASMQHCELLKAYGSMSRKPQLHQEGSMKQPFSPQCGSPQGVPSTEINTKNSISNVSFPGSGKGNASTMLRNVPARWPQQTSMLTSYNSSQMETDQRPLGSLQAGSFISANHNMLSMQQTNFSPRTNIKSFNSTRINGAPTATTLPSFNSNNEMWSQNVQFEKLKQTIHQSPIEQRKRQVEQKTNELNDALLGHATSPSSRMQQLHSVCQPAEFSPQIFLSSSPRHLHATSPQASRQSVSSSIADTNNMLSPLSIGGTSVQPATSPLILSSPSNPSSLAVDTEKDLSTVSPLTAVESTGHPRTLEREIVDTNEPGASTTSLLADSTCANDGQHSHAMGRLIKAVKSLSSKAFHSTLKDINYVMNVIDCIDGTPRGPVGQDLAADVWFHLQNVTDCGMEDGPGSTEKLQRNINALVTGSSSSTINESDGDNFVGLTGQASDVESTSTSMNKRPKNELIDAITKEIKQINRKLVETLLELVSDCSNEAERLVAQEGTEVRCTYTAVCFPELLRPQWASPGTLPNFRLLLFVPKNYPNSSPVVLDVFSDVTGEQLEELLDKVKARFNMSLRTLSQPICLLEMARIWNASCRAAFTEFAQKRGGTSFSERYGSWEKCVTAP